MRSAKEILSQISYFVSQKDIDELKFQNIIIEYPIADIIKLDWKSILDPPPLNSSKQTINELKDLVKLTNNRSPSDIELINNVDALPEFYINEVVKQYNIDSHINHIKEFYNIIRPIVWNIKFLFNRPRPFQLSKVYGYNLNVINTLTHHTPSYPSGHTVYASLYAMILGHYYPELNKELNLAVKKTMLGRMLQGVHYNSDNQASLILSKTIFEELKSKVLL